MVNGIKLEDKYFNCKRHFSGCLQNREIRETGNYQGILLFWKKSGNYQGILQLLLKIREFFGWTDRFGGFFLVEQIRELSGNFKRNCSWNQGIFLFRYCRHPEHDVLWILWKSHYNKNNRYLLSWINSETK